MSNVFSLATGSSTSTDRSPFLPSATSDTTVSLTATETLKGGGSGGGSSIELRVAVLETNLANLESNISSITTGISDINKGLDRLLWRGVIAAAALFFAGVSALFFVYDSQSTKFVDVNKSLSEIKSLIAVDAAVDAERLKGNINQSDKAIAKDDLDEAIKKALDSYGQSSKK